MIIKKCSPNDETSECLALMYQQQSHRMENRANSKQGNMTIRNKNGSPLLSAMGSTKCLDNTGGLEISAISIKPTISRSAKKRHSLKSVLETAEDLFMLNLTSKRQHSFLVCKLFGAWTIYTYSILRNGDSIFPGASWCYHNTNMY